MRIRTKGGPAPLEIALPDGGVLTLRPWASAAKVAGRQAFTEALNAGASRADADVAFTAGVAAWAAVSWSGVFEEPEADTPEDVPLTPLEMTPELVVVMVTEDPAVFDAIDTRYVLPGLRQEAEKNGSAPSLAGAGPAGALKTSSERPGADATTAPPAATSPAPNAPPASMPARPRKPKRSGARS
ncbi:hypothetical protein [Caulobacter sp. UNC279MFTsu5.1]|uniref:hypothetical protein n=1 Tax=Caulobacter sp. UNC279MFTsu5.1 TaxID=1502775 RepID=UPI0008EF8D98|nr:hypothetical protein [Caulobacter sp. UNC279MFTsu5.1]SFK41541.1 hypothetical protein SAMN02799626_04232 [Caulobacter sp. UNC279MFTsu5.1]